MRQDKTPRRIRTPEEGGQFLYWRCLDCRRVTVLDEYVQLEGKPSVQVPRCYRCRGTRMAKARRPE